MPTVSLTSPRPGTSFAAASPVTDDGIRFMRRQKISKVEFFAGPVKIGQTTTAPYKLVWSSRQVKLDYNLYAKAWTPDGCTAVSGPVAITIKAPVQTERASIKPTGVK